MTGKELKEKLYNAKVTQADLAKNYRCQRKLCRKRSMLLTSKQAF